MSTNKNQSKFSGRHWVHRNLPKRWVDGPLRYVSPPHAKKTEKVSAGFTAQGKLIPPLHKGVTVRSRTGTRIAFPSAFAIILKLS